MTDSNLKAKAEAATAGPWTIEPHGGLPTLYSGRSPNIHTARHGLNLMQFSEGDSNMDANIAFIAAANPTTVLALIAQIDQLQSELTTLKAQVDGAFNEGYILPSWEDATAGLTVGNVCQSDEFVFLDGDNISKKSYRLLREKSKRLSRPTKPTEAKDGSK